MPQPSVRIWKQGQYVGAEVDMWPTRDKLGPDALSKLEAFYGDHKSSRSFYTASKLIFCIRCKATKKEIEALVADILANVVPDEGLAGFGNI